MKIGIIGATGYTGAELLRILANHSEAEIKYITSESQSGVKIMSVYPHLKKYYDCRLVSMENLDEIILNSDVIFIALPHGHAMDIGRKADSTKTKIIDLGADYRFKDVKIYEKWYKKIHTHAVEAVYGLSELYREDIKSAKIIANPGCYTTASILALAPLIKFGLVNYSSIIIDAKSGISGAGRTLKLESHFSENYENLQAYSIAGHRHRPEIEEKLSELCNTQIKVTFTPHLIPMTRGILSTCYANLNEDVEPKDINSAYETMYGNEYFIRLLGEGGYPATKNTRGSNFCDIGWHLDKWTNRIIVVSAIDNLVKGAAGQAVQNMNIVCGIDECIGLNHVPLYP